MPSSQEFSRYLKHIWSTYKEIGTPLVGALGLLFSAGVISYANDSFGYQSYILLVCVVHIIVLIFFIIHGLGTFDDSNKSKFILTSPGSEAIIKDSDYSNDDCWKYAKNIWESIVKIWHKVLMLWLILYFFYLVVELLKRLEWFTLPTSFQSLTFNTINNIETILIVLSLSYLVKGWRRGLKLGPTPRLLIIALIILIACDVIFTLADNVAGYDYSLLVDFISGILTGIFFGFFISVLNSRYIGYPNTYIVVLFLYCCFMTVYPILDYLLREIDQLIINTCEGEVYKNFLNKSKALLQTVLAIGFLIALMGKIFLVQLFRWEDLSSRFFVYLQLQKPLMDNFDKENTIIRQRLNS